MSNVMEKVCDEKHISTDYKLDKLNTDVGKNSDRIRDVEEAIVILTGMAESNNKKSSMDKTLVLIIFVLTMIICTFVLGPEITEKILGGIS